MESNSNDAEYVSWDDLYNINLTPSELFLKFRKEIEGFRVGVNLEFYNFQGNDYHTKLVLKPLAPDRKWKFIYEPKHGDIRLLSKKIPITQYLNLQVGLGHSFHQHSTGWKWKVSTCFGGDGMSQIRNKTSVGLFPGLDVRFGWRAEYILPEIHGRALGIQMSSNQMESDARFVCARWHHWYTRNDGGAVVYSSQTESIPKTKAMGTGEPVLNMNYGRLQASLDRVEAIITQGP